MRIPKVLFISEISETIGSIGVDEVFYSLLDGDFVGAEGPVEFLWFAEVKDSVLKKTASWFWRDDWRPVWDVYEACRSLILG